MLPAMSITTSAGVPAPRSRSSLRARALRVPVPELWLLLLVAAVLDLWALDRNGWANTYYAAAVRSMSTSWHDFLYNSFDAAGVMTVDKPPLSLWVQALSARVFGLGSWSLLVPQALMGVATVWLTYDLVRRRFGRAPGFAAGLVLATTPITVAISRHDNPDALVVLCSVAALWALLRALEDGRTRWLVLCGVAVGLGFEAKMATALLVVPALAAAYLRVAPRGRLAALQQLGAGGAAMAVVGLAWPVLVWLTPAADRPWISGTSDNSIWSLILDYNGAGRLDGQAGGPRGMAGVGPAHLGHLGGIGPTHPGGIFGGGTGVTRLLDASLGGQAGWLIGMALVGGIGLAATTRLRRADARTGWVIAVGGAFLTTAVAFSFAKGIFHPYYVSMLAPFTAALAGAVVAIARTSPTHPPARVVAPLAIAGGVVTELVVLHRSATDVQWVAPIVVAAGLVGAGALAAGRLSGAVRGAAVAVALGALLIAPASWAADTLGHATSGTFPAGGPANAGMMGGPGGSGPGRFGPGGFGRGGVPGGPMGMPPATGAPGGFAGGGGMFGGGADLTAALAYAKAHGGGTIGVSSQMAAADSIIQSGADVAALGGFSGRESQVSVAWLAQAVRDGRIRYVLADGAGGTPDDGRIGSSLLMAAVQRAGRATSVSGLYDLRGRADALLATGS